MSTRNLGPPSKVVVWVRELRAPFFTATLVPVVLGATTAWNNFGVFDLTRFVLTLVAALCLHAGANMIDDYFDYKSGCDLHSTYEEFWAPFFGGSRMLPLGLLKPRHVYVAALLSFALGGAIGVFLALETGYIVVLLGVVGVVSGYYYVTHLSTWGVGEFFVFLNFGPLMAIGSYYVQVSTFAAEPIIASIPIGLLLASVLWINEIADYIADRTVEKKTLVVRLGRKRAVGAYTMLMVAPYAFIVLGVGLRLMPAYASLALVTTPLVAKAVKIAMEHFEEPSKMVSANALTVQVHLFTGLLLILGYVLSAVTG